MKLRSRKLFHHAQLLFKLLLLTYAAMGACNLTYGKPVISWVMYPTFCLGLLLVAARAVQFKRFITMPGFVFAVLMWLSYVLSAAINAEYQSKDSIVYLLLWSFYFFLLYTQPSDKKISGIRKEFELLSVVYMLLNTVLVCISFAMLLSGHESSYRDPGNKGYEVASGFFAGRLWGAYQDPNLGSVMACVTVVLCAYWFLSRKNTALRCALAADGVLMLMYMALSDSRTGMVCLGSAMAVWFIIFRVFKRRGGGYRRIVGELAMCAAVLLAGVLLPKAVQMVYNDTVSQEQETGDDSETYLAPVDRGYNLSGDISNRRFDVWQSGVEIGLLKPVTGLGYVGAMPYAREHLPDTFVVADETWIYTTFDNELINVFVAQGFIGLVAVLAWFVFALRTVFSKLRFVPRDNLPQVTALTVLAALLIVSALFQGTMFYQTTANTVLFWLVFGYLLFILKSVDKENA